MIWIVFVVFILFDATIVYILAMIAAVSCSLVLSTPLLSNDMLQCLILPSWEAENYLSARNVADPQIVGLSCFSVSYNAFSRNGRSRLLAFHDQLNGRYLNSNATFADVFSYLNVSSLLFVVFCLSHSVTFTSHMWEENIACECVYIRKKVGCPFEEFTDDNVRLELS